MYKLGFLFACLAALLFSGPASADTVTIRYVAYAPAFLDHGVYHITNAPGSYDIVDFGGYQDIIVPYDLTLTVAPLPPGATLISAWLASQQDPSGFNNLSVVRSSVTPVSPGPFEAAEWQPGACLADYGAWITVGGSGGSSFDGSSFYEDISTGLAAQLAAGTTIQASGWVGCGGRHGFFFPYPGFNANTEFTWDVNSTQPALLQLDITYQTAAAPVPEPGTLSLLGIGLLGFSRMAARTMKAWRPRRAER